MFIKGWMDKENMVYTCTLEYYSGIKKNKNTCPFERRWMEVKSSC